MANAVTAQAGNVSLDAKKQAAGSSLANSLNEETLNISGEGTTEAAATAEGAIAGRTVQINDVAILKEGFETIRQLNQDALAKGPSSDPARAIDLAKEALAAVTANAEKSLSTFSQVQRQEDGGGAVALTESVGKFATYFFVGALLLAVVIVWKK